MFLLSKYKRNAIETKDRDTCCFKNKEPLFTSQKIEDDCANSVLENSHTSLY